MVKSILWEEGKWHEESFDFLSLMEKDGIYETMSVVDGKVMDLQRHKDRFAKGCQALGLSSGPGPTPPCDQKGEWTLRWARWKGGSPWGMAHLWEGSLQPPKGVVLQVGCVGLSDVPTVPAPDVKHLSVLGRTEVRKSLKQERGWDDYFVVEGGEVLEGSHWAVMGLWDGVWIVPSAKQGMLRSTKVASLLVTKSFEEQPLEEGRIEVDDLIQATDLRGPSSSGIRTLKLASDALDYLK
ncbi:aminotransferase class IV [bacterium]|nr:aminotransferase class IV [bacterium]